VRAYLCFNKVWFFAAGPTSSMQTDLKGVTDLIHTRAHTIFSPGV